MSRSHSLVALAAAAFLSQGCTSNNQEPHHFASSVNQVTKNWSADAMAFGTRMRVEKNPVSLRGDLDRLQAQIRELVAKAKTLDVPPGKEAQELSVAFQTYLADQESMVTRDFEELISIRSSPTPDLNRFRDVLARCQQIENADLRRLHQAEAAYAIATGTASAVR